MNFLPDKSTSQEEEIEITFIQDRIPFPEKDSSDSGQASSAAGSTDLSRCSSYDSLSVNYDSKSVLSDLASVSSEDGPIEDIYCKARRRSGSSRLRTNPRTRIEPSILNHLLDLLSIFFWKCSTGCQQIPDRY